MEADPGGGTVSRAGHLWGKVPSPPRPCAGRSSAAPHWAALEPVKGQVSSSNHAGKIGLSGSGLLRAPNPLCYSFHTFQAPGKMLRIPVRTRGAVQKEGMAGAGQAWPRPQQPARRACGGAPAARQTGPNHSGVQVL